MGLFDELLSAGDANSPVQALATQFGIQPAQAGSAISALAPILTGGLRQQLQQPLGGESLLGLLASGPLQQAVADPSRLSSPEVQSLAGNLLKQLLGGQDVGTVAAHASAQTGLNANLLQQMLPSVAALLLGSLGRQAGTGGGQPNLLASLTSLLDANQDGSIVDDVMGMARKFLKD
jgi:Uncharacterized conserved protein